MKKTLLLLFALIVSIGMAWGQDTNLCAETGVTAKIGDTDVAGILTSVGAQPSYYDANDEMNIVVDLQSTKTIEGFSITFSGDRWVSKFALSYSTNGSEYTKIADYQTGRIAQNPETTVAQAFASSVTARYIKYTSKKSDKNDTDQWSETIKFFRLLQYGTDPSIPAIVSNSHKLGIYSQDLGKATNYGWDSWGGGTGEDVTIQGKNAYKISAFHYFGSAFPTIDATTYAQLHIDVYPSFTGTLAIIPITGATERGIQFDVIENTWKSIDLPIDDFVDLGLNMSNLYQIKYVDHVDSDNKPVNGDGTHSFFVGNVYLYGTPFVDTEKPVMTSVTVASSTHKTATLTVNATDNDTTHKLTYTVKNSSDVVVSTGSGNQGEPTTIIINGLTASTNYAAGDFKVTATDHANNVSTSMDVPAFSTAEAPTGQTYTNGSHEILVQPRHYTGTFDYEFIVISEEVMTNFSNSYWKLNGGPGGTLMNNGDLTLSDGGKVMTVKVRSTTAPVMDTPLYINMPGEVAFRESNDSYPVYDWIEVASDKTYDVMVSGDKATVVGTISSSNLSEFRTSVGNASIIDISGASIANDITNLTTNNINAIFDYKTSTAAEAATKTINSVYPSDVRFYGAPNGLTFVDDPANVPLLPAKAYCNIAFNDGKKVVINREIAAGKYVTTYMGSNAGGGMNATLETGLEAYELTKAEAGQLTFTKVNSIAAGKGYVIHNTTSGALTMTWQTNAEQVYLDEANQNEESVTAINGVKIIGTLQTITTDGNQWLLSSNQIKKGNGAKISPYRAYFTGVSAAATTGARAIFVDGETTKIGSINANGEINVEDGIIYNLAGQRVQNPKKGIYIINGKKVMIK